MPSPRSKKPTRTSPAKRTSRRASGAGPRADDRSVTISHPEKVLFPADGITKGDLAAYYEAVAAVMLPHLAGRPITMERFHRGIGEKGFFQKNLEKGFPAWLERVQVRKKDGTLHHPVAGDLPSLLWLANQNAITLHVWTSRAPRILYPDVCVFDLDPLDDDLPRLRAATLLLRDFLDELGLACWVKTSGSKGYHVVVPLDGKSKYGDVARFAHAVGEQLVRRDPDNLTREFYKQDRGGRILVDTGRNEYSATFAAAYTVRAKDGAPVSAPCTWEEIASGSIGPRSLTLRNLPARLAKTGDPWADLPDAAQSLKRALARLKRD